MRIGGYQPLSLSDYPGKACATIFTQGCPLRCAYCHNPELLTPRGAQELSEEEVLRRLAHDAPCLDGACVTGGEPTIHADLASFLLRVRDLGLSAKLDTNGINPPAVARVLDAGAVDYLAMDIKHRFDRYPSVTGVRSAAGERAQETMWTIAESGVPYEFRTTVWGSVHTHDDLVAIGSELPHGSTYALQALRTVVTLAPELDTGAAVDLNRAAAEIRAGRPDLTVIVRG